MGANVEHQGIVRRVSGGEAVIAVETGGCSGCGHLSGCGVGQLAGRRKETLITLTADVGLSPGDRVSLSLATGRLGRGAFIGYFLPALAMVAGAAAGGATIGSDAGTALGLGIGLATGLGLARVLSGRIVRPEVKLLQAARPGGE